MKFHDIAIGQRFEASDGAVYLKTGPLLASPEVGSASRFMARSAQVKPLDGAASPAKVAQDKLLRADDVVAAFDVFYGCCTEELARCESLLPAEALAGLRAAIETGRSDFLGALTRHSRTK